MHSYQKRLRSILTPPERQTLSRLDSSIKLQNYLDRFPINFELSGETYMSPRRVLREKTAHCFEAALFAAATVAYHGGAPLLLDLKTIDADEDHVVALFRQGGLWGAISKTNHMVLRYRDPIYRSVRELALSYFHEYTMDDGTKSLRSFSVPFDLSKFPPARWVAAEDELFWLVDRLERSRHIAIAPEHALRRLRAATSFELKALEPVEWSVRPEASRSGKRRIPGR